MHKTSMPRDPNQLAKAVVDFATGQRTPLPERRQKDPAAVKRGRLGGIVGGKARAANLSPEARAESARRAAEARWARERAAG
jgi:hypothetical protein